MRKKTSKLLLIYRLLKFFYTLILCFFFLSWWVEKGIANENKKIIITSDTLIASMASSILPSNRYVVHAILPPEQCPGHYDIKLRDIEKINNAYMIITFKDMPFLNDNVFKEKNRLIIDARGHNLMSPNHYEGGLKALADMLKKHFEKDAQIIERLKNEEISRIKEVTRELKTLVKDYGLIGKKVIASYMQKEPLEWMGLIVVGNYGRHESLSTKDIVELIKKGKKEGVVLVVDNLQSGPDTGKSISEALGVPHVVLTNFPNEKGYLETLKENIKVILKAFNKR